MSGAISANSGAANFHRSALRNGVSALVQESIPDVSGGNSRGAVRTQECGVRVAGFIGRYHTVAMRSSEEITTLSSRIASRDRNASQQLKL